MKQNQEPSQNNQAEKNQELKQEENSQNNNQIQNLVKDEDTAIDMIHKWIWINCEEQFKQYQSLLSSSTIKLKDLIRQEIEQENQYNWKVCQKYNIPEIQAIINNLRNNYQSLIAQSKETEMNPENKKNGVIKQQIGDTTSKENAKNSQANINWNSSLEKETHFTFLPLIKPKGKIYNQKQLSESFHLLKQTEQDYQIRSPILFNSQLSRRRQPSKGNLINNKYLKMTFKYFCKQSYNTKGLFSEFSQSADKMNLNKWMVFCKEFQFTQKFNKKDLIQIYQTSTRFASVMVQDDFLTAVAFLQEKYINKYRTGENFVNDVLQINSEAAFKIKMSNLKVSYAGPKKNFMEYGTYTQKAREEQMRKQRQFTIKKKQRQLVLIKGMYESHLKDEISSLKEKREAIKESRLGKSVLVKEQRNKINNQFIEKTVPIKLHRFEKLSYSRRFNMNKSSTTNKNYATTTSTKPTNPQLDRTQISKIQFKNMIASKIETVRRNTIRQQATKNVIKEPQRQWIVPNEQETMWMTNLRSDSQQSDDILKEHLQIQKKTKIHYHPEAVKKLMDEMKIKADWVDSIKNELEQPSIIDEQMIETQPNFKRQKEIFL